MPATSSPGTELREPPGCFWEPQADILPRLCCGWARKTREVTCRWFAGSAKQNRTKLISAFSMYKMQTLGSSHRYQSNKMVKMSDATCRCALNPDFQLLKARLLCMITNSANLNPPTTLSKLKQKGDIWCQPHNACHLSANLEHKARENIPSVSADK